MTEEKRHKPTEFLPETRQPRKKKERKKGLCLHLLSVFFLYYVVFGSENWVQGLCMLSILPATELQPLLKLQFIITLPKSFLEL